MTVEIAESDLARAWQGFPQLPARGVTFPLWKAHVLLHLHRHDEGQRVCPDLLAEEGHRTVTRLAASAQGLPGDFLPAPGGAFTLAEGHLVQVAPELAAPLHRHFHYLGSPRADGLHLGLACGQSTRHALLGLVTLSTFDLEHLAGPILPPVRACEVLVLSRLVAFPWSPRNTASFMLARLREYLRQCRPAVRVLLTYLDPNLGFTGATYRADNWVLLGRECKKRYLYLDREYVTDRDLIRRHGTADFAKLRPLLGSRLEQSRRPLEPLVLYGRFLDRHLGKEIMARTPREVQPPCELVGG